MKWVLLGLAGVALSAALFLAAVLFHDDRLLAPDAEPGDLEPIVENRTLITVNTTRIGSDDPVLTAVAVSQIIYPVTEEENVPGAIILVNMANPAEALVAASRIQHFPVNAPILYVTEDAIPEPTRNEMLRLEPEGVPMDGNTQVYLVGTIGEGVRRQVRAMGYRVRVLKAPDPVQLAEVVDRWTSTQHGDHRNAVVVANLNRLEAAIPSAFWNAHMGDGLVFVTDDGIPEATRRMLERRGHGPWLYLFGDETVIPAAIARELASYGHVTRIPRSDPPGISAYFAGFRDVGMNWGAWYIQDSRDFGWGLAEAGHNAIFVNLDGPGGWQNALCATTLSHMGKHAPVLVVGVDAVPEAVASYLEVLRPYRTAPREQLLNHGWIIGGLETISWETQAEIDLLLEGQLDAVR